MTRVETRRPVLVTLGPAGRTMRGWPRRYLNFREVPDPQILLVEDFELGLERVRSGDADFILICGVHPQCAAVVGKGSFLCGVHVVDVFISPSQPLGIVTRRDAEAPRTLALHPATESYTDLSPWPEKVYVNSIVQIAEGLLDGRFDSGLTALTVAEENPEVLRVDRTIGSPDDPWVVLGRQRVSDGSLVAWKDAPAAALFASD